jgi:hypothetical protein
VVSVKATAAKHERGYDGRDRPIRRGGQETSEETKLVEANDAAFWLNPRATWAGFATRTNPGEAGSIFGSNRNLMRESALEEGVRRGAGMKASRREPQERDRDETSPTGRAGSKASRGCETLRAQHNRRIGISPGVRGSAWLARR